jgi:hypothetical protein
MKIAALSATLACALALSACAVDVGGPDHEGVSDPELIGESAEALLSTIATADMPTSTVSDGSHVYFTAWSSTTYSENIYRVPVTGGSKQKLVSCTGCGKLAVDGSYLYFNNGGAVYRIPKAGGTKTKLATSYVDDFADMALDSYYVYFAGHDGVKRVPKAGGSVKLLSTKVNQVRGLTLDASYVYWVNLAASGSSLGTIYRVPKAGGTSVALLSTTLPYDVVVDSSYLYWTSLQSIVWRSAKDGKNAWPLAYSQNTPTDLAANGTHLFWTNSPSTGYGSVKRMAKTGGTVSTLASNQSGPECVTVAGSAAYWANYTGDRVMKATF